MAVAEPKVQKAFRTSPETSRLIELLAALERKDQGDLLSDMVNTYLVARSNTYAPFFTAAAALAKADPNAVAASTEALREALLNVPPTMNLPSMPAPSARERLAARQQGRSR